MNHYIHLRSTFKLPLDETLTNVHPGCSLASLEGLKFLAKLIYGNKLVKYLHWGINRSTFESYRTSFPTPSKISQIECLFMISNDTVNCQFNGSIKCIPEGPPPGQLRSGMIFCAKSPTLGDKLLSNFPRVGQWVGALFMQRFWFCLSKMVACLSN